LSKYVKIISIVLYGCESWSLTLREEYSLRVFENRVLTRIFGIYEVTGEWRRLHNKELYALYSSPHHSGDQVKKTEMGRRGGTYGGEERCIQGFIGET
jgi:hypothetical protein